MTVRGDLEPLIVEALSEQGGRGNVTSIAKYIWENHRRKIESHPTALYTWQYDMRWAGQALQKRGVLKKHRTHWELL